MGAVPGRSTRSLDVMPKDRLAKYELHDAQIGRMVIDHSKASITIDITYYPTPDSPKRKGAVLVFDGVEALSHVASVSGLLINAAAGNISYWEPSSKRGTTFIHLATGTIAINAKSLAVKERA